MLCKNKPYYGIDAPVVVRNCIIIGLLILVATFWFGLHLLYKQGDPLNIIEFFVLLMGILCSIFSLAPAITIILGSFIFKFRVRDWMLDIIKLQGDEKVLDVGCGRGLMLIGAAKKLTTGKVIGIDIWSQRDQSANSMQATLHNARLEKVIDKIELVTGDMRAMPFADNEFDVVLSSWAIHNIYDKNEREKALREIVRVIKPGGLVAIVDIEKSQEYFDFFKAQGFCHLEKLGPKFTFGNQTYLVLARK